MALQAKMTFSTDDDDDLDVDALRLAALQTLKKTSGPQIQSHGSLTNVNHVNNSKHMLGGRGGVQNRGRGRGIMGGMRRGMHNTHAHRGRGNFSQNFFPSRQSGNSNLPQNFFPNRASGNSNLITIVPTVPDEDGHPKEAMYKGSVLGANPAGNVLADSTEDEKVPAKFRRLDDDSESEESDEDPEVKTGSDIESSGEDNDVEDDPKSVKSEPESEKEELVSLQHEDDNEADNSLERLMQELEDEISDAPKDTKTKASVLVKENTRTEKAPKLKKAKKDKHKKEKTPVDSTFDNAPDSISSGDKPDGASTSRDDPKPSPALRNSTSPEQQLSKSPERFQPAARSPAPIRSSAPLRPSPLRRSTSPRLRRSPVRLRSRSPRRSRSPLKSRSPLRSRSPRLSRSPPRRSPPRGHYPIPGLPGSRSPYRSPRRSPLYLAPRVSSPSRLPPLRSRSRSPRLRSRSPGPARATSGYVRRSRTPLGRMSPYRRSRSPGRLYTSRRSRSTSPRARRSPVYVKKLSPKRRSISPRRRSISPRRRSPSPRRRSVSPRRRSVSPRRHPASPGWTSNRPSPPRSRSPLQSPRRRSPFVDSYSARRSPSPLARAAHRGNSPPRPPRGYRSPSPTNRHHRVVSMDTSYRRTPPKPSHSGSPGRLREKPKQLSPLPPSSRNIQRLPSPRRQRSPGPYLRGHHVSKALSPARKVSPPGHNVKRTLSPSSVPSARQPSSNDSISLSPSPDRQPASDRNRSRKSHPLGEGEPKKLRADLRNVLPRRKDLPKDSDNVTVRSEEASKRERKEKKQKRKKQKKAVNDSTLVLEARRRKFESGAPVEIASKKIRLRGTGSEEKEVSSADVELNVEKEKERELKEVNEVDESILDRELMGGVDLLWSDEEEEEEDEIPAARSNVQFKRTFSVPPGSSSCGKENIPDDSNDSKKDEEEEPTSTTGSPLNSRLRDDLEDIEDCDVASELSEGIEKERDESHETWPKTNRELKEYILSQAKGAGALVRFPKQAVKESCSRKKSKSNESDVDLRAELSRRRAERLTKVHSTVESLPGRLLQSALQGVGVKSRKDKSHRRRTRSPPSFEDDEDQQESEGRRVLVLRRAAERKEPAINITISKVEPSQDSSNLKISGKLPIHMRLGTSKKGDDSPKKVKLNRNVTVGRKKQV